MNDLNTVYKAFRIIRNNYSKDSVDIPGYNIKSFNDLDDARKYYYDGFFDDSDVRIYTLDGNKWYLYQENYTLVKIPFK